jgi:outer membrane receptor protein involved in Fe transport
MEYSFLAGFKYSTTDRNNSLDSYTLASDRRMENGNGAMDAYKEDIIAGYLSLKKTFGKLSLKAGVRSEITHLSGKILRDDYNDEIVRNEHEFFPYFYGIYHFSKSKSLSLSYSKTIYRPSFNLLSSYATRVSDFMYDIGNPNLRPQISNRVELKYKLNKHFLTVYMRQIPNLFAESWEVKNSIIYHSNANNGEALYTGLRYSYSGKITNRWFLNWSSVGYYSHIPQSHYKKEYFSLVLSANNRFKISSKSTINLSGQYRSSSIATNTYTIGHYLVDVSFEHSFLQGALDIRLSFADIFNTVKQESYIKTPQFNYDFHQKLATRGVMLRVSYNISSQKKILNKRNNYNNDIINRL